MSFDNERKKYGRKHLWYVEIEVNGTTYRFCENVTPLPAGLDATPSLKSVSVNPAEINLEGGIGVRARARITLAESMDYTTWGTITEPVRFWSRWRAENPYYLGERISVFSGYIVNNTFDSANFIRRDYIIESFAQAGGGVSITGKDPLKLASNDRAKAPVESRGALIADITDATTVFILEPSGIGSEYPISDFYIRVGDEVMYCSGRVGDSLTVTRAQFNTVATDHSQNDTVQLCLYYNSQTVSNIDYNLLTTYAGVDPAYIDKATWDTESATAFPVTYTTLITEPTGVQDLLKEFAQSAPHYLYWDERVNKIRFTALKPPPEDAQAFNYDQHFLQGSTAVQDKQDMRVSTVIINYGIFDPTKDLDEVSNYRSSYVREDSDSVTNYGQRAYKKINSRWITSDNKTAAVLMASRIGRRFASAPRMLSFELDASNADIWTGDSVRCQTDLIEQSGGGFPYLFYQILSAGEGQNYKYSALEHTYGAPVAGDEDVEDPNVRLIYISGNQDQLKDPNTGTARSLRDIYEDVYGLTPPDAAFDIRFIFESNCVAGSSDNTLHAVRTGSWPELITPPLIINNGLIVGKGGDGANVGATPEAGGPAILLENNIRLDNLGIIGGAGGGANGLSNSGPGVEVRAAGGGGAGYTNGNAGSVTTVIPAEQTISVTQAEDGTNTSGGARGVARGRAVTGETIVAFGGFGGDLGQAGGLSGGAAGKAIDLNGFAITYVTTGDIRGAVS